MIKAYKYQLDLTEKQKQFFAQCFGSCRFVYNRALNERVIAYQTEADSISAIDLIKQLKPLKKKENFTWLKNSPNQCLQFSIRNMDSAFTKFFREKKGFPKFKSKFGRQSCQFYQNVIFNFDKNKVKIPKLGYVSFFCDRSFDGRMATVTVSRNTCGKYYISALVHTDSDIPDKFPITESNAVGIDVGIKDFATLSTGEKIANPKYLRKSEKRLAALQRRLAKKKKGSNRRQQAKLRVAKIHYKISCQRKDFLHKLTTKIIRENQTVIIEDLHIAGMVKNRKLSKSISDVSWSEFFRQLKYKAEWSGVNVITIGRFEPSSKMCSCGVINKELTLKDRTWTCSSCHVTHDRDILAANNIKRFGLQKQNLIGIQAG